MIATAYNSRLHHQSGQDPPDSRRHRCRTANTACRPSTNRCSISIPSSSSPSRKALSRSSNPTNSASHPRHPFRLDSGARGNGAPNGRLRPLSPASSRSFSSRIGTGGLHAIAMPPWRSTRKLLSTAPKELQARLDLALASEKTGDWLAALITIARRLSTSPLPKIGSMPQIHFDAQNKYKSAQCVSGRHLARSGPRQILGSRLSRARVRNKKKTFRAGHSAPLSDGVMARFCSGAGEHGRLRHEVFVLSWRANVVYPHSLTSQPRIERLRAPTQRDRPSAAESQRFG